MTEREGRPPEAANGGHGGAAPVPGAASMPDVVYTRARILVPDGSATRPGALWTRGERIAGIGPDAELLATAAPGATVVDLDGAVILPGLNDAHAHISQVGYLLAGADCAQPGAADIPAIQGRLAAAEPGGDGWVTGSGFAEYKLTERRMPTRWELDAAVPDRPCVLYQVSLHACVVNSAGLVDLGYDERTPDPPGGRLGRDREGRLDGSIFEGPMFELYAANQARTLSSLSASERIGLMERAAQHFASLGITATSDAAIDEPGYGALREADDAGRLPIRVTAMFWCDEAERVLAAGAASVGATVGGPFAGRTLGPEWRTAGGHLRIGAIKLFSDGGMSSRTAAVDEPYAVPAGTRGVLLQSPDELAAMVRRCADAGFQVGIHAQGDWGIRVALDALEAVTEPGNPRRHRIEHGGLFTRALRERAGRLGIVVVSQPGFISILGDGFVEAFGPARAGDLYPFASLRDAGVVVAGSSDAPVIPPDPFRGIRDAILRRTEGGAALAPGEVVPAAEALAMYTSRAAFADHREADLGSLTVGRLADLTIVDRDPLTTEASQIAATQVLRTVVGARPVFLADQPSRTTIPTISSP